MIDKTGADCLHFRPEGGQGREPELDVPHVEAMVRDLYRAGWSYRLIAQFGQMANSAVREILLRPDPDLVLR